MLKTRGLMEKQTMKPDQGRVLVVDALQYPVPARRWFLEWQVGGVGCVHVTVAIWENAAETLALLGKWNRAFVEHEDLIVLARTADDVAGIAASGRTAVVLGFQNTAPIEHSIDLIGQYHELGVRIMQLTYNLQNYIGSGYWEETDTGLSSRFGRAAVAEMNRVGILVDLSHCGERTTLDAIEHSTKPVSITHANVRELVSGPAYGPGRLKTTEAVKALAERGGVLGVSLNRALVAGGVDATRDQFIDLLSRTIDLIGIDAVGLGTDYCAGHLPSVRTWWRYARWSRQTVETDQAPHEGWQSWFPSPEAFGSLIESLETRGFSRSEIEKIGGGNWLRLFDETFGPGG